MINILTDQQEALSNHFAGMAQPGVDPLADASQTGQGGAPIFDECLAWFDCERYSEHEAGDHTIYVGRVAAVGLGPEEQANPLTYFRGKYRTITS